MDLSQFYPDTKLEISLILFLFLIFLKNISGLVIHRSQKLRREKKRKIALNFNSFVFFVFSISLLVIWQSEIKEFAISFLALAVAFVIATKEIILCLMGGIYRALATPFHLGDRVEVDGVRGDVINRGLLSTTLLEIGPGQRTHQYTGRSVTFPNSNLLTHNVQNESFMKNYVLHTFTIPMSVNSDWQRARKILLKICGNTCSPYIDSARRYIDYLQRKAHLETPKMEPRVHVRFIGVEEIELIVRVTVPYVDKGKIEQDILMEFLRSFKSWREH